MCHPCCTQEEPGPGPFTLCPVVRSGVKQSSLAAECTISAPLQRWLGESPLNGSECTKCVMCPERPVAAPAPAGHRGRGSRRPPGFPGARDMRRVGWRLVSGSALRLLQRAHPHAWGRGSELWVMSRCEPVLMSKSLSLWSASTSFKPHVVSFLLFIYFIHLSVTQPDFLECLVHVP